VIKVLQPDLYIIEGILVACVLDQIRYAFWEGERL
jgi:hypothetical protein